MKIKHVLFAIISIAILLSNNSFMTKAITMDDTNNDNPYFQQYYNTNCYNLFAHKCIQSVFTYYMWSNSSLAKKQKQPFKVYLKVYLNDLCYSELFARYGVVTGSGLQTTTISLLNQLSAPGGWNSFGGKAIPFNTTDFIAEGGYYYSQGVFILDRVTPSTQVWGADAIRAYYK